MKFTQAPKLCLLFLLSHLPYTLNSALYELIILLLLPHYGSIFHCHPLPSLNLSPPFCCCVNRRLNRCMCCCSSWLRPLQYVCCHRDVPCIFNGNKAPMSRTSLTLVHWFVSPPALTARSENTAAWWLIMGTQARHQKQYRWVSRGAPSVWSVLQTGGQWGVGTESELVVGVGEMIWNSWHL